MQRNLNRGEVAKLRSKNQIETDIHQISLNDANTSAMNLPGVESDTSDDAKQTYKAYNQNIDTDLSLSQDEDKEGVSPSPMAQLRCPDPIRSVTSSDSDSFTDSDAVAPGLLVTGGTNSSSCTSESEETQIWVPAGKKSGSGSKQNTLTSCNTINTPNITEEQSQKTPGHRNSTPTTHHRDIRDWATASVDGGRNNLSSGRNRSYSWEDPHNQRWVTSNRKNSPHNDIQSRSPRDVIGVQCIPNGDSGIVQDVTGRSLSTDMVFLDPGLQSASSMGQMKEHRKLSETMGRSSIRDIFVTMSGLYAMVIVVFGAVTPIAEIYSGQPHPILFQGFYIYLYTVSIGFLVYAYTYLLQNRTLLQKRRRRKDVSSETGSSHARRRNPKFSYIDSSHYHTGSFYLRLGAVGFGIGSMIQSGLQCGEFFEVMYPSCYNVLHGVSPLFHLAFTFVQLYFIFLNSKMCIHRYKVLARFGLMHMVATNLCVWFDNIVRETLREIRQATSEASASNQTYLHKGTEGTSNTGRCNQESLMKSVIESSGPYLYPCSIEYSLICAGILYVMWRNTGKHNPHRQMTRDAEDEDKSKVQRLRVDCSRSSRGLFLGIFVLVTTVIGMITFFVLLRSEKYQDTAIKLEHLSEIVVHIITSVAVILSFYRMQRLKFNRGREIDLEEMLILISLSGVYIFGFLSIIASLQATAEANGMLITLSSVLGMFQATLQTMLLLNALKRSANKKDQERQKPGREMITFLLMCNIALWGFNTFEVQRSAANPVQLHFYGSVAWNIFNHISLPLKIFFRFHSTVCFSNIWKNAWKYRSLSE